MSSILKLPINPGNKHQVDILGLADSYMPPGFVLMMIVRDEEVVIERCLKSVLRNVPITHWCIVDTGSTDKTCQIIRKTLGRIPGVLKRVEWTGNFGFHRHQALELAEHCPERWAFTIDADETVTSHEAAGWPYYWATDAFTVTVQSQEQLFTRFSFVKLREGWKYKGRRHECLVMSGPREPMVEHCHKLTIDARKMDGARTVKGNKLSDDLEALNLDADEDPDNPRTWFYLGLTNAGLERHYEAREAFQIREQMGNRMPNPDYLDQEVWYSIYAQGAISESEEKEECLEFYRRAWELLPRAEPAGRAATFCLSHHMLPEGLKWAKACFDAIKSPRSGIFFEHQWHSHLAFETLAVALWMNGYVAQALDIISSMIQDDGTPAKEKPRLLRLLDEMKGTGA